MLSVVEKSFLNPDWFLEIISVDKKVNLLLITDVKRQLITVITQVNWNKNSCSHDLFQSN
jgi:hypothetical protein